VVVRSSGIGEDSAGVSFAGLHESFVNLRGVGAILEHIRLVWASLWSDRALLYRQGLGLDIEHSAMPVVLQDLIQGDRSGVAFSKNPNDPAQAVIEAVYGLNQYGRPLCLSTKKGFKPMNRKPIRSWRIPR
jgi:phosphoenolpyruvate synthase/pyruvate phosphate dikinase